MQRGKIYTIGHGGRTTDDVLAQLQNAGVEFVIDVRSVPYSRHQPEFAREPLSGLLERHGIRYVFMGELLGGRPEDDDCYTDGKVDYQKCRQNSAFAKGFARVHSAFEQGFTVCLLCSEAKPWRCHRSKLLGETLTESGFPVAHLMPDGTTRTQEEVMRELTGGQTELFGQQLYSRNAYR